MTIPFPTSKTDQTPCAFLAQAGSVFAVFGEKTQDSGNVSYAIEIGGQRYFVKTAGAPEDKRWFLSHEQRVALLHNAIRLRKSCPHAAMPVLHQVIESPHGPMLVYEYAAGEHLRGGKPADQNSAFKRFTALPVSEIAGALDVIYELHDQLADAGWIAEDFYDGCLIYDFDARRMRVVDLDHYHQGPFVNEMGRMFGSTRFMSPEEFVRGAAIDQRSTVFTLGRTAAVFLGEGNLETESFRGTPAMLDVLRQACQSEPQKRFQSVKDFRTAWRNARNAPV